VIAAAYRARDGVAADAQHAGLLVQHVGHGLAELGQTLQRAAREMPDDAWIDLERYPLDGVTRVDRYTYRIRLRLAEDISASGTRPESLLRELSELGACRVVAQPEAIPLLDAFDRGELDAVIVRQEDDRRDGEDLGPEHFGWFAAQGFNQRSGEPLRLAALAPCCGVRDIATRALSDAGIEWTEVFVGGGHAAVVAAVSAGLAVAAFSCRLAPADTIEVGQPFGLPELPASRIMLHSTLSDQRSREALRALAAAYREHRVSKHADAKC